MLSSIIRRRDLLSTSLSVLKAKTPANAVSYSLLTLLCFNLLFNYWNTLKESPSLQDFTPTLLSQQHLELWRAIWLYQCHVLKQVPCNEPATLPKVRSNHVDFTWDGDKSITNLITTLLQAILQILQLLIQAFKWDIIVFLLLFFLVLIEIATFRFGAFGLLLAV